MGDDFSAFKLHRADKLQVASWLEQHLRDGGYEACTPEEATRSLVLGPPGEWLHVGDTVGMCPVQHEPFTALAAGLSHLADTVMVVMSDSCVFALELWRAGARVDQYASGEFPWFHFQDEEAAKPFRGHPELWTFAPRNELTEAFAGRNYFTIGKLLGWPQATLMVGYTQDWDGMPVHWREIVSEPHDDYTELHYRKTGESLLRDELNWRSE